MDFQISHIDPDRLLVGSFGGQAGHDTGEHAHPAPALPSVVEGLGWAVFTGRDTPAQAIAIDENYTAQRAACHGSWERRAQAAPSARQSARKDCSSEGPLGTS